MNRLPAASALHYLAFGLVALILLGGCMTPLQASQQVIVVRIDEVVRGSPHTEDAPSRFHFHSCPIRLAPNASIDTTNRSLTAPGPPIENMNLVIWLRYNVTDPAVPPCPLGASLLGGRDAINITLLLPHASSLQLMVKRTGTAIEENGTTHPPGQEWTRAIAYSWNRSNAPSNSTFQYSGFVSFTNLGIFQVVPPMPVRGPGAARWEAE
jgi:hypothetical protein